MESLPTGTPVFYCRVSSLGTCSREKGGHGEHDGHDRQRVPGSAAARPRGAAEARARRDPSRAAEGVRRGGEWKADRVSGPARDLSRHVQQAALLRSARWRRPSAAALPELQIPRAPASGSTWVRPASVSRPPTTSRSIAFLKSWRACRSSKWVEIARSARRQAQGGLVARSSVGHPVQAVVTGRQVFYKRRPHAQQASGHVVPAPVVGPDARRAVRRRRRTARGTDAGICRARVARLRALGVGRREGPVAGRRLRGDQDAEGYLWLGTPTRPAAVRRLRASCSWASLNDKEPLPTGPVHALVSGHDGSLWVGLGGGGGVVRIRHGPPHPLHDASRARLPASPR